MTNPFLWIPLVLKSAGFSLETDNKSGGTSPILFFRCWLCLMSIVYPRGQRIVGLPGPCSSLLATPPYDRYNSTHSQINRRRFCRIPFWHNKMRKLYVFYIRVYSKLLLYWDIYFNKIWYELWSCFILMWSLILSRTTWLGLTPTPVCQVTWSTLSAPNCILSGHHLLEHGKHLIKSLNLIWVHVV